MLDLDKKVPAYGFLSPLGLSGRGGTTERVVTILREAIIGADLAPGADIDKQAICDRLGISRFPVSEALARLQVEGLVEIMPQRGTRVSRIRLSDVRQNIFIRKALEGETVRVLATDAAAPLAALERNLRYQRAAMEADDRRGFHALDLEFHEILLDALAFNRVKTTVDAARASLDRVRRFLTSNRRLANTLAEHEAIIAALTERDAGGAVAAMHRHLDAVISELLAMAAASPGSVDDA